MLLQVSHHWCMTAVVPSLSYCICSLLILSGAVTSPVQYVTKGRLFLNTIGSSSVDTIIQSLESQKIKSACIAQNRELVSRFIVTFQIHFKTSTKIFILNATFLKFKSRFNLTRRYKSSNSNVFLYKSRMS